MPTFETPAPLPDLPTLSAPPAEPAAKKRLEAPFAFAAIFGMLGAYFFGSRRPALAIFFLTLGSISLYAGVSATPSPSTRTRGTTAGHLAESGQISDAISGYDAMAKAAPSVESFATLGGALLGAERFQEADDVFTRALEIDHAATEALLGRATARYRLKRFSEAAADYKELLRLDPDNVIYADEIRRLEEGGRP